MTPSETKDTTTDSKNLQLEPSLKRIQDIVRSLEQNEVPLEDSLKLFEEGVSLTRACHQKLNEVERRIEILTKVTADGIETKPYRSEGET